MSDVEEEREVNKERVQLLVDALAGKKGVFQQGLGFLTQKVDDVEAHCCLGIACIVAIQNGLDIYVRTGVGDYDLNVVTYEGKHFDLPNAVRDWYGFAESNPMLRYVENGIWRQGSATTLNDDAKFTFSQIAKAFEITFLDT